MLPSEYIFKMPPLPHQAERFARSSRMEYFAFLDDMGAGKSKMVVDEVSYLYQCGEINGLLIVAPSSIHTSWVTEQFPKHMPEVVYHKLQSLMWRTKQAKTKKMANAFYDLLHHDGLAVFLISYESFITEAGKKAVWKFLQKRRVYYCLDEAHHIKDPGGKTTKSVVASGKYAMYRRICTGSPVSEGPFDAYPIFKFLSESFWKTHDNIDSFDAFKHEYAQFRKGYNSKQNREFPLFVRYRNLEKLNRIIAPYSGRVLKSQVLNLPPKNYTVRDFELSTEQRRVYDQLCEEYMSEVDGTLITVEHPLARLTRLQQVACGYLPNPENLDEPVHVFPKNPRIDIALEVTESTTLQGIIWGKYHYDLDLLCDALGKKAVRFDGTVDEDERERARLAFIHGDAQWFCGNPACGAEGLTLIEAEVVLYYDNDFSLRKREQSEDRAHRIGQTKSVQYIDLIAERTVDEQVLDSLQKKMDVAAQITGDTLRAWISRRDK